MRLAVFTDNFYPELSGIADVILTLGKQLVQRGHQLTIFAPRYAQRNYQRIRAARLHSSLVSGITVVRWWSVPYPTGTQQGRMVMPLPWRWLQVKRYQPEVIHSHHFFGVGLEALWVARRLGLPLIGTKHTAIEKFLQYSPIQTPWTDHQILRYVNWYYRQCQVVTAPTQAILDTMEPAQPHQQYRVITNPIDETIFYPISQLPAVSLPLYTIVHAGRLAPERSVDVLIRAMVEIKKSLPEVQLRIVGHGTAEKTLRRLAKQLQLGNTVQFLGYLPPEQLAQIYHTSQLFVITSQAETQSLVALQAMATGLPVVAVDLPVFQEWVTPTIGALVPFGDVPLLASTIVRLLRDQPLCQRLRAGCIAAASHYSASQIVTTWEELYRSLL
ncbi:MAG: glycosyltransferase [Candidatus Kerfeldbacteria bacterium]|nr:glycosyltransferase [Candidatus Kerfeldbacteria bacterium]